MKHGADAGRVVSAPVCCLPFLASSQVRLHLASCRQILRMDSGRWPGVLGQQETPPLTCSLSGLTCLEFLGLAAGFGFQMWKQFKFCFHNPQQFASMFSFENQDLWLYFRGSGGG